MPPQKSSAIAATLLPSAFTLSRIESDPVT